MTEEKAKVINVADRCDRCGAQAYVWVNGVNGDLFFCAHHYSKYENALKSYAFEVIDERDTIG